MRYLAAALCGFAMLTSTAVIAQRTLPQNVVTAQTETTQLPERAQKIVSSKEFQEALRTRDTRKMDQLLEGTGTTTTTPVAIFFCRPPTTPVYINGKAYCQDRRVLLEVHPYMYQ